MNSSKHKDKRSHKKDRRFSRLINSNKSDSEAEESEHELSFYIKDRVRLMKEILKIIKPKKLKTMAPDCMKNMDMEEVNSLLLEELLGISSKRLRYIFDGKNLEEDSSSSDEDIKPDVIDIISLDDVSEDDFIIDLDSDKESSSKSLEKRKSSPKDKSKTRKKVKKEKSDKEKIKEQKNKEKEKTGEENLMTVLELLELQARARAIRSQLVLENNRKAQEQAEREKQCAENATTKEDEEDAVIAVETTENIEIVITSESEEEQDAGKEKPSSEADKESSSKSLEKRKSSPKDKSKTRKKVKKEKSDKEKIKEQKNKEKEKTGEENLMTVLELLELQARARAIRSQLVLENNRKAQEQAEREKQCAENATTKEDEEDAVIAVETTENIEIVITSESEEEQDAGKEKPSSEAGNERVLSSDNNGINSVDASNSNKLSGNVNANLIEENSDTVMYGSFPRYNKISHVADSEADISNSSVVNNTALEIDVANSEPLPHQSSADQHENLVNIPLPDLDKKIDINISDDNSDKNSSTSRIIETEVNAIDEPHSENENLSDLQIKLVKEKEKSEQVTVEGTVPKETVETDDTTKVVSKASGINLEESLDNETESSSNNKADVTSETLMSSSVANQSTGTIGFEEVSKLDMCVKNLLQEEATTSKIADPETSLIKEAESNKGKQKSKEKRILNLKNKLKSYKHEMVPEPKIKILENVVVKAKSIKSKPSESRNSLDEGDGIIINVDQDEFDCIICD